MVDQDKSAVTELEVLGDVLQIIGDVRGEQATFDVIAQRVSGNLPVGSHLYIYGLDQKSLQFRQIFPPSNNALTFKLRRLSLENGSEEEIHRSVLSYFATDIENPNTFVQLIFSLGILRAVVVLRHKGSSPLTERDRSFIATLARALFWVLERERLLQLFKEIQTPVNFRKSESEYFVALMNVIELASQMSFIAIREHHPEERALRCIAQRGFGEGPLTLLDLEGVAPNYYQPFYRALTEKVSVKATQPADCPEIFEKLSAYNIKSFIVVPVQVGDAVFGTLSFACAIDKYQFSILEQAGLEAIANAVGVSIANFRSFNREMEEASEAAVRDMALVAVEIAQFARHAARDQIEEGEAILDNLRRQLKATGTTEQLLDALKNKFRDLEGTMERIKEATTAPSEEFKVCSVHEVWEAAFRNVQYKLDREDITWEILGNAKSQASIFASFDHLRLTFSQLILNTFDAFSRQRSKQRNRQIRVEIIDDGPRTQNFVVRYSDNAGGIDPSKLRKKTGDMNFTEVLPKDIATPAAIFQRGVTSKGKDGSGYGLFLVRKVLSSLGGSIDLVEYRGGQTIFEMKLPKPRRDATAGVQKNTERTRV